jgi:hypothetical protein
MLKIEMPDQRQARLPALAPVNRAASKAHSARPLPRFGRFKRVRLMKLPKFNSDQQLLILAGGILLLVLTVWRYFSLY